MNMPSEGRKTTLSKTRGFPAQEQGVRPQASETHGPALWTCRLLRTVHAAMLKPMVLHLDTQTAQDSPPRLCYGSRSKSPQPRRTQVLTEVIGGSPTQPSKGL